MPKSLALDLFELRREVSTFIGMGADYDDLSDDEKVRVDSCIRGGLRDFYWSTALGGSGPYTWSFMRASTTIATVAGVEDYELGEQIDSINGPLVYGDTTTRFEVTNCDILEMRRLRQLASSQNRPIKYAIEDREQTGKGQHRTLLLLWPQPSAQYTLHFQYDVLPHELTEERPYPLGSSGFSEVMKAAVLACAENQEFDQDSGAKNQRYQRLLAAAVQHDLERVSPESFGYNMDMGAAKRTRGRSWLHGLYPAEFEKT